MPERSPERLSLPDGALVGLVEIDEDFWAFDDAGELGNVSCEWNV